LTKLIMPRDYQRGQRGRGQTRGRGRGRATGRPTPYDPPRRRFGVTPADLTSYEASLPSTMTTADRDRLLNAKRRELHSQEAIKLLDSSFTWQPSSPSCPHFPDLEAELVPIMEANRVAYREKQFSDIRAYCVRKLANNSQIVREMEAAHNMGGNMREWVENKMAEQYKSLASLVQQALETGQNKKQD
jgi:hypothetical protein